MKIAPHFFLLLLTITIAACNFGTNDILDPPQYDITVFVQDSEGNPVEDANVFLFESRENYQMHIENNPQADPLLELEVVKAFGTTNEEGTILFEGIILPGSVLNRESYTTDLFYLRGYKTLTGNQDPLIFSNDPVSIINLDINAYRLEPIIGDGKRLSEQVAIRLEAK